MLISELVGTGVAPSLIHSGGQAEIDGYDVVVSRGAEGTLEALRLDLVPIENLAVGRMGITLAATTSSNGLVLLEADASDLVLPQGRIPPDIARLVLSNGSAERSGVKLPADAITCNEDGVSQLAALILDIKRLQPLIVVAPERGRRKAVPAQVSYIERHLAALAPTYVLATSRDANRLSDLLGTDLRVPMGSVRLYPGSGDHADGWSVPPALVQTQPQPVALRIQTKVLAELAVLEDPAVIRDTVLRLPGFPLNPGADSELFMDEALQLEARTEQATRELTSVREDLDISYLELADREKELAESKQRVRFLESRLRELGDHPAGLHPDDDDNLPETVESCTEAVGWARSELSATIQIGIVEPMVGKLDFDGRAPAWGMQLWTALLALDDYARLKSSNNFNGNFLRYCSETPPGCRGFPPERVALKESESTMSNATCRQQRTFSIPREVDGSGVAIMEAHLKIQKRGSPAPRLHFLDDTRGPTGQILIGYIGPHLDTAG